MDIWCMCLMLCTIYVEFCCKCRPHHFISLCPLLQVLKNHAARMWLFSCEFCIFRLGIKTSCSYFFCIVYMQLLHMRQRLADLVSHGPPHNDAIWSLDYISPCQIDSMLFISNFTLQKVQFIKNVMYKTVLCTACSRGAREYIFIRESCSRLCPVVQVRCSREAREYIFIHESCTRLCPVVQVYN